MKEIIIFTAIAGVILLLVAAFWIGIIERKYRVSGDVTERIRILLITDLHSCFYGKEQTALLKKITACAPDLICMSGDIYDDKNPPEAVEALLKGLEETGCPVYYAPGNHEYRTDDIGAVLALFERYGATVLIGESVKAVTAGGTLLLSGIGDPEGVGAEEWQAQLDAVSAEAKASGYFSILLSHRPERVEAYQNSAFDLVLCGHAHGGQWRIPLLMNGLLAPNQGFFPKYAGGQYVLSKRTVMIVSRGLALNNPFPRIFNPPELVIIDVEKKT